MKKQVAVLTLCLVVVILMLVLSVATALGQSTAGSITGAVKDTSGASVPDASVIVTNPSKAITLKAMTDQDGGFLFPDVEPGTYTISVEKPGFKKFEKRDVVLSTGSKVSVGEFVLVVGSIVETVTVQADAGRLQIQSESGERSDLVTNKQIRNLALNGRNILDLTKTVPGIINTSQNAQSTVNNAATFNVNGTRGKSAVQ